MISPERKEPLEEVQSSDGTARWVGIALGLLTIAIVAALWTSARAWRASERNLRDLKSDTQTAQSEQNPSLRLLSDRLAEVQNQNISLREEVAALSEKLEAVKGDAETSRKQVQKVSRQDSEQMKQLAAVDSLVREELESKANSDDLKTVRSDVASARDVIKTTNSDFQIGREMGTLIARNHDEIEALRQMGERDYFEFTLKGKNTSQRMGDITLTLRSTDPKKNECNLDLLVDEKQTQKRNRQIDEPIFFYTEREQSPAEIVINQVAKNEVIGYLSLPKKRQQITIAGAN